ncbi:MAG: hypothetical protein WD894_09030 [Pirellulales bacterium]
MRLTLRNMLASMDEILEPAQQDEIKQKIEESEFATSIMHRVRDVTRRIRLGAPKLTGKGMGLDPNTVSMYLDNTLSAERVPDFEKVCLESDVHLAEVAACHQVLALVLGEPAEVDAGLRQKLYDIGQSAAAQTEALNQTEALKPPPPLPAGAAQPRRRERPRVPDYLRGERRSRWWAVAATVVLAVLLAAAVIRAIGPYDRTNRALAWLPIWEDDAQVATNDRDEGAAAPKRQANGAADEQSNAAPSTDNGQPAPQNGGAADADGPAAKAKAAALQNPLEQNGKAIPLDGPQVPADTDAQAPIPPEPAGDSGTKNTKVITIPSLDLGADAAVDPPAPTRDAAAPSEDPAAGDDPAARNGPEPLGRFLQDRNVLLRFSRRSEWQRVAQGATLNAGERLLVLPTYRPSISLTGGLTMQVLGETLVELLGTDAGGVPRLQMPYGRAVLMTAGKPNVSIQLVLGGQEGTATFLDAESTLAVEVRRFLPAGANPETEQAYVAIDLYADGGDIEWKQSANPVARRITAPGRLGLGTPYPYATDQKEELPAWISAEKVAGVHEIASEDMNQELTEENEKPVALVLREFAEHRKWERKHLGARSLALVGEFDAFLPAFNDSDQRSVWTQQIESLQAALARGPETAAKVRETFQQQRGREDGWKLYRILGGYSKSDVQAGAAEQLVGYLGHNSQEFRVLAIHALRSIPGVPQNYSSYLPFGSLRDRQIQVRNWRGYLEGDKSPLSPEGALDQPGPTPKQPWRAPTEADDAGEESASIPRSVPILR